MEIFTQLEVLATQLGSSPWLLGLVLVLTVVDGVLPPVPSETILITAAVLSAAGDGPHLLVLVAVAAAGAFLGDLLAFGLGRHLPVARLPGLRGERGVRALTRAAAALDRRGATVVVTGRFVPVGRVAVNVGAGALGLSPVRFVAAAAVAGPLWAGYNALIGIGAHSLLGGSALLSTALGILAGLLTGVVIEALLRRAGHARRRRSPGPAWRAQGRDPAWQDLAPDPACTADLGDVPRPETGRDLADRTPVCAAGRWLP